MAAPTAAAGTLGGAPAVQPPGAIVYVVGTRVDEIPPEMRQAYIVGIQEQLNAHGYYVGDPDGVIGSKTKGAIRQYQRDAGLPVNGVATKELLDHLMFAEPKVYKREANAPAGSQLLLDTQYALQQRGYYQGPLDGLNGPMTREAIRQFQADAGLPVTGSVGAGLLADLRAADPSIKRN